VDVGLANPQALPFVSAARTAWDRAALESRSRPQLVLLTSSVLLLARSPKSREADDLAAAMTHLVEDGWRPAVPHEAVDLHTKRGRETVPDDLKLVFWLDEGSKIVPDGDLLDWRSWVRRWAARRGRLDPEQVEKQIAEWAAQGRLMWGPDGYPIEEPPS
jgi:hypothetical protein